MAQFVVASVSDVPAAGNVKVTIKGRPIIIFEQDSEYYALMDRCPHQGASLSQGARVGLSVSDKPGEISLVRQGEIVRCPWHGWEFDIKTGQSHCDPANTRIRKFNVHVMEGKSLTDEAITTGQITVAPNEKYLVVEI